MRKLFTLIGAALISAVLAGTASAAPLYTLTLEASADGGNTWTTDLTVAPNTTYLYEVVGQSGAIGASNADGKTITSLTSADGMVSSSFNVNDTSTSATPVTFAGGTQLSGQESGNATTLVSFYNNFASASDGTYIATADGNTGITGIRPISSSATDGPSAVVIATGTFTTGSTVGATSVIGMSYGTTSGAIRINGGSNVIVSSSDGGSDPIIGFNGLTLTGNAGPSTPEPASVVMAGLGLVGIGGLTILRRRNRKA